MVYPLGFKKTHMDFGSRAIYKVGRINVDKAFGSKERVDRGFQGIPDFPYLNDI
tara:strand:+ start:91 stop:252 length:162 start_codon:yes stop_codon:yes gene_type:complete